MALEAGDTEQEDNKEDRLITKASNGKMENGQETQSSEGEEEEEEEEDEEPRLKYASLTKHLKPVYRNADATSAFLVGGDKMVGGSQDILSGASESQRTNTEVYRLLGLTMATS